MTPRYARTLNVFNLFLLSLFLFKSRQNSHESNRSNHHHCFVKYRGDNSSDFIPVNDPWILFYLCRAGRTQPFTPTQWGQQTVRKLHLHLHSSSKNHANLNETVPIVAVIENPFFVNYCFPKSLVRSHRAETKKKLLILGVVEFKMDTQKLMLFIVGEMRLSIIVIRIKTSICSDLEQLSKTRNDKVVNAGYNNKKKAIKWQ